MYPLGPYKNVNYAIKNAALITKAALAIEMFPIISL